MTGVCAPRCHGVDRVLRKRGYEQLRGAESVSLDVAWATR